MYVPDAVSLMRSLDGWGIMWARPASIKNERKSWDAVASRRRVLFTTSDGKVNLEVGVVKV